MEHVIVIDSDEEPASNEPNLLKRTSNGNDEEPSSKVRRLQPTKIGDFDKSKSLEVEEEGQIGTQPSQDDPEPGPSSSKNELTSELEALIKACRSAERSEEMKAIIKKKLLKYYHSVHPDYVTSSIFLKTLKTTTEEILREPTLVYSKLKTVIEELDVRRKSKVVIVKNSEETAEILPEVVDESKNKHLSKLTKALKKIKQKISDLDELEVDWDDDDNSSYMQKARFEKRACEIYEKICEITGESKHAHRAVKKPIVFKKTEFREFNKILERMVNEKGHFPNYRDVLKRLDLCNRKYGYGLPKDQQGRIAQDAFEKLGKLLQQRRKSDLYETTTFYAGKTKDPAKDDPELRIQLEKNKKNYAKYDEIINLYVKKEEKSLSDDGEEVSSTSKIGPQPSSENAVESTIISENNIETVDSIPEITYVKDEDVGNIAEEKDTFPIDIGEDDGLTIF